MFSGRAVIVKLLCLIGRILLGLVKITVMCCFVTFTCFPQFFYLLFSLQKWTSRGHFDWYSYELSAYFIFKKTDKNYSLGHKNVNVTSFGSWYQKLSEENTRYNLILRRSINKCSTPSAEVLFQFFACLTSERSINLERITSDSECLCRFIQE